MHSNVAPSAPYTRRAPSPPQLHVPVLYQAHKTGKGAQIVLAPSYENIDPSQLTAEDLAIITRNETELVAPNMAGSWAYEKRREAQRILDFLYVGPNAVIRDLAFLQRESITMIIVARDSRLAGRNLLSVDNAIQALGIVGRYIDVGSPQELIQGFPDTIRDINNHLLSVYHSQSRDENGQLAPHSKGVVGGKVLVTCESGNELAPTIVAAYVMSVFGQKMASTLQFISVQRFCVCFDEVIKRLLLSWEDILRARASVAQSTALVAGQPGPATKGKRGLDHLRDEDEEMGSGENIMDHDRFRGRDAFVPFVDLPNPPDRPGKA